MFWCEQVIQKSAQVIPSHFNILEIKKNPNNYQSVIKEPGCCHNKKWMQNKSGQICFFLCYTHLCLLLLMAIWPPFAKERHIFSQTFFSQIHFLNIKTNVLWKKIFVKNIKYQINVILLRVVTRVTTTCLLRSPF